MATLYNWSKYNNVSTPETGYMYTTTYYEGSWVLNGSYTQTSTRSGYTSYAFDSSTGQYSAAGSYISIPVGGSGTIYHDFGGTIQKDVISTSGIFNNYSEGTTNRTSKTTYTYYSDSEGSLINTFYDVYDAHTLGSKNSDGYWYERGSVYNYDPTVSMNYNNGTSITSNLQINKNDKSDFVFNIVGNDQDTNDTIQYKVQLNGVDHSSYKGFLKNVFTVYTIPFKDLTLGNNTVTVFIQDSKGYSISQSFILRNKVPQNLSLHSVLDSETALGYGNTSFTDLRDLMPSGYTGALSMADYVDYLS